MNHNLAVALILVICSSAIGWLGYSNHTYQNKLERFVDRCEDKGGIALKGFKGSNKGWIGCYNVKEIENEE